MRIAVFGSGAVGGYFGGRLAQAGEEVVFLARGEHQRAIRDHGLRVKSPLGDFLIQPARVTDDPAEVKPVDVILLGVKAWQVTEAAGSMRGMIGEATAVVPLQNGVEAPMQLGQNLGATHVLGGTCRILSQVEAPGLIRHAGVEPYIAFGELDGHSSQRVEMLRRAFSRAVGVTVETPEDIRVVMWRKFLLIAPWSGIGALSRAPLGVIRGHPETRQLLQQAIAEVYAVARAHEVPLPEDAVETTLASIDRLPPDGTTSMQRDIIEGRPSELMAQSGAVVRLGRAANVPVPVHTLVYQSLLPLERRARGEIRFPV